MKQPACRHYFAEVKNCALLAVSAMSPTLGSHDAHNEGSTPRNLPDEQFHSHQGL